MNIVAFFSPRWRWVTVAVICGIIFLARLGVWQLDRLEWRREINAATMAEMNGEPILLNSDLSGLDLSEMINRPVVAIGEFDFDNQFLVESQRFENQPGRYLLTPLQLAGSEQAVLVNRGWIPIAETDFAQYDQLGEVEISGRIQQSQTLSGDRKTEVDGNKIFRIDVAAAADTLTYPVLPIYLLPETGEVVDSDLPYLPKADLSLDEGNHLSYAIQWFFFAVLLAVMYAVLVNRQEKKSD